MEQYSRHLAEFVSEFPTSELPAEVLERSRQCVLNAVASALSGSRAAPVGLLLDVLGTESGPAASPLIGRSERMTLLNAALVNAYMAHYDDYDDTHRAAQLHTNPTTVPILLGLGALRHTSGKEALAALALGIEASVRLGMALGETHGNMGWHTTGTVGTVGAGLTASRLLHLDPRQTNIALGLALTQAAGLRGQMFGTMAKAFNAAKASQNGLLGALLAERGFTAAENSIEGGRAYARAASREADLSLLLEGLGTHWEVTRVGFKPYASGAATHATVDAAIALRLELGLQGDSPREAVETAIRKIEELEFTMHEGAAALPRQREIDEPLQAKFSIYNVAAIVLVRGKAGPAEYNAEVLTDPTIAHLRQLINVVADPTVPNGSGSVRARLVGGRQITIDTAHALGTVDHPLDDAALRRKLADAATGIFDARRIEELAVGIESMETATDVGRLAELAAQ